MKKHHTFFLFSLSQFAFSGMTLNLPRSSNSIPWMSIMAGVGGIMFLVLGVLQYRSDSIKAEEIHVGFDRTKLPSVQIAMNTPPSKKGRSWNSLKWRPIKLGKFIFWGVYSLLGFAAIIVGIRLTSTSLVVGVGDIGDLLAGIGTLTAAGIAFATLWISRRSAHKEQAERKWSREDLAFLREIKDDVKNGHLKDSHLKALGLFIESFGDAKPDNGETFPEKSDGVDPEDDAA